MPKHYEVKKIIICSLRGEQCGEAFTGKNNTCCDYCEDYREWKKSGLTLEDWADKVQEEEEKTMW